MGEDDFELWCSEVVGVFQTKLLPEQQRDVLETLLLDGLDPKQRYEIAEPLLDIVLMRDFMCDLPIEISFYIQELLDPKCLACLRRVSTGWRKVIENNDRYWKRWCAVYGFDSESIVDKNYKIGNCGTQGAKDAMAVLGRASWFGVFQSAVMNEQRLAKGVWHSYTLSGHTGKVTGLGVDRKMGYIVSGSYDRTIKFWDVVTGRCQKTINAHTISSLQYCSELEIVITSSFDSTIRVWDMATEECKKIYRGHTASVFCVEWMFESRLIFSGSADGYIKCWSYDDQDDTQEVSECIHSIYAHGEEWVVSLILKKALVSSDYGIDTGDSVLVSASLNGLVKVWNASKERSMVVAVQTKEEQEREDKKYFSLFYDGNIIVYGDERSVRVYETRSFRWIQRFPIENNVCIAVDRTIIASCSRDTLRVCNRCTGKIFSCIPLTSTRVHSLRIVGGRIVIGTASNIYVLELK
eukprot:Nk52_evm86s207 gene=Nk52_evmTU86s207